MEESAVDESGHRFHGVEDRLPPVATFLLGFQHVLAMFVGIITPPLILTSALSLDPQSATRLLSAALLTSGMTTLIQVLRIGPLGSGLLSVQGTSFAFVPAAIQAGKLGGLALVFGMTIAGSFLEMVVSRFLGPLRRLFPPVVTGSVVILIGVSLIPVGVTDLAGGFGAPDLGAPRHLLLGGLVTAVILITNSLGGGLLRTVSIATGLAAGYGAAILLGRVDFARVEAEPWITLPALLAHGVDFRPSLLGPWLIAYLITTLETIGDVTATSAVSREPVEGPLFVRRIQGAVLSDGVGSLLAGMLGCTPNTTFAQNNGVIRLTGVASRRVGVAVGVILITLGLVPKLAAAINAMPRPVLGGATLVLFATVAVGGLRIVVSGGLTPRTELVLALSLGVGIGTLTVPEAFSRLVPAPGPGAAAFAAGLAEGLRAVLGSAVAAGGMTALLLNLVLPPERLAARNP